MIFYMSAKSEIFKDGVFVKNGLEYQFPKIDTLNGVFHYEEAEKMISTIKPLLELALKAPKEASIMAKCDHKSPAYEMSLYFEIAFKVQIGIENIENQEELSFSPLLEEIIWRSRSSDSDNDVLLENFLNKMRDVITPTNLELKL